MIIRLLALVVAISTSIHCNAIRVLFDYRVFHVPGQGPFVEFVTSFDAATFTLAPADSGLFQSTAEMTLVINKNGKILDFRKVKVEGPMVKNNEPADFLSLERFMLPVGVYDIEVEIQDLADPSKEPQSLFQKIEINNPSKGAFISDIEFVSAYRAAAEQSAFSKSGYDMLPYISNHYPTALNGLIFYAEMYRTDSVFGAGSPFVSNVYIVDAKDVVIEKCKKIKREKAAPVIPMLHTFDITDLPTGDYKVKIEIRDKENMLVYLKERPFTRTKMDLVDDASVVITDEVVQTSFASQFTDRDELYDLILYHLPIAGDVERGTIDNQLESADLKTLQSFLYSFWVKKNKENPEAAFRKYETNIKVVKQNFATRIKPGWQTDRGRVYLQYGKPNTRVVRPSDADYWPYEIWHYYVTDSNLHNRRFLFYDTKLSGDHELLHSDVPGEVKNFGWKDMVRTRPGAINASDASRNNASQRSDPYSGDEIEDLWYNPH